MSARRLAALGAAIALGCSLTPATANAADTVFDQADAQELADTLAEATQEQGVCYGWRVAIDDQWQYVDSGISVGSNFGAGREVGEGGTSCRSTVEFTADIVYTSESSESEDSASYSVISTPRGPTTDDLDELELVDEDGLVGDFVDLVVYKAVAALPLLAADNGIARPMVATPAPEAAAGDSRLTDSPGSDFWRENGSMLLWGTLLLAGGVLFGIYALRNSRRQTGRATARTAAFGRHGSAPSGYSAPDYLPSDLLSRDTPSAPPDLSQYPPPQHPPSQYPPPQNPPGPQDPPQGPAAKE